MIKTLFGIDRSSKEKYGFNFPLSNGAGTQGINDAGVETFKGSPNKHLAKEIIQNSLDAKNIFNKEAVRVEFKLKEIYVEEIPYVNGLIDALEKCKDFWGKENDRKSLDFINKGLNTLGKEYVRVLEISDYNTTGLRGARQAKDNIFAKLVTDSGVSNKKEGSGGSFGIGKNAPYTCSDLRTVLYSTLDIDGVQAIQGVSRLLSHRNNDGLLTQGKGFLGVEGKNEHGDKINHPFVKNNDRDDLEKYIENKSFIRKEQGTSLHIIGYSNFEAWEDEIIIAILDYYMISIADGDLEVVVGNSTLNKDTLETYIHKYKQKFKDTFILQYYRAYTLKGDNVKKITYNFNEMGDVDLYLLLEDEICNKKVAYVRSNGMKIIDKDRFKVMCKFNGVLVFRGQEINEFIRSLENPSHDKIEPDRYVKPAMAGRILRELAGWIRDTVNELSNSSSDDIIEMEGLGQYLPAEGQNKLKVDFKETIKKKIKNTKMKKIDKPKKAKKIKSEEADEEINVPNIGGEGIPPEVIIDPTDPPKEPSEPNEPQNPTEPKGGSEGENKDQNLKAITIEKSRVMASSGEGYKVLLKSKNKGKVYIGINLVGEVGADGAKLLTAKNVETSESYEVKGSYFGPVEFEKGELKKFEIQVKGKSMYSMEVETSADNR